MFRPENEICVKLGRDGLGDAADVKLWLDDVDERMIGDHGLEKSGVRFEVHQRPDSNADTDIATIELKYNDLWQSIN